MNYYILGKLLGNVLKYEAAFMGISVLVSIEYKEDVYKCFLLSMAIMLAIGIPLSRIENKGGKFSLKDGYAAVALSWLFLALFGALPFYLSGYFKDFADCFFESASGITTTGATLVTNIEALPKGILFWRSFTQWIGGMGVLIFMLAIMPMNASYYNLLKAETPGPKPSKMVPKLKETAKLSYLIYVGMTILPVVLLHISGMSLFDSFIHAFGTAGTGGFSSRTLSMGAYNNVYAEMIVAICMLMFGVSFSLYYSLAKREIKGFFKDEELRLYFGVAIVAIILVTLDITKVYGSVWLALRHAIFQVSSLITTTGYATVDYNLWPSFSKMILLFLMICGSCAGSTGGGLKMIRLLILLKSVRLELNRLAHPRVVKTVKVNDRGVDKEVSSQILLFFFIYILLLIFVSIILAFVERQDLVTTVSASIAALSNIGPGLGIVGPMGSFAPFSAFSKCLLAFCMIVGRLEIFPVLLLFTPSIWKGSRS